MNNIQINQIRLTWQRGGLKTILAATMAMGLVACGPSPENDPVYLSLKANPPKEIPARHLPKLRKNIPSCDVFNRGQAGEYMTCWLPLASTKPHVAILKYYGPGLIRPNPEMLYESGGDSLTTYLPIS